MECLACNEPVGVAVTIPRGFGHSTACQCKRFCDACWCDAVRAKGPGALRLTRRGDRFRCWFRDCPNGLYDALPGVDKDDPSRIDWRVTARGVVQCPVCRVPIERIDGCSYMLCRCGTEFCWPCGEVWTVHHMNCKDSDVPFWITFLASVALLVLVAMEHYLLPKGIIRY
jgi:hypothetical protein